MEDKKKKKAGRNSKYTTEQLMAYIEHYINNTAVIGQINASKLAEYVKSTFNINFDYRYFNRNDEVKKYIQELNNLNYTQEKNTDITMIPIFNADKIVDVYKNDIPMLKQHLRGIQGIYEELDMTLKVSNEELHKVKNELDVLKMKNDELHLKNKELIAENKALKEKVNVLNKFKTFDEYIGMLNYLQNKNIISAVNKESFELILKRCKFIDIKDSLLSLDISLNDEKILNDTIEIENNKDIDNLIDFNKTKSKKAITQLELMRERLTKK